MKCFRPLDAWSGLSPSGGKTILFGLHPPRGADHLSQLKRIFIPCGQCINCRLERSRQWAVRCVYEASLYDSNSFVTLTYSSDNIPSVPSGFTLFPDHLSSFIKRLRKRLPGVVIRFFGCGEYGDLTSRPHYHLILFNYFPSDLVSCDIVTESGFSRTVKRSAFLTDVWGFGHVVVGNVSFESCAYVARYLLKKITGPGAVSHYEGRVPEFVRMSRRPGIASGWYDSFRDQVIASDTVLSRGHLSKPPRYFDKLTEKFNPLILEKIKAARSSISQVPDFHELKRVEEIKDFNFSRLTGVGFRDF